MTRRSALLLSLGAPAALAQISPVRWTPHPVFNGAPILFRSKTYSGPATWLDKPVEFRPDSGSPDPVFTALAGVDLKRKPGRYPLVFPAGAGLASVEVPVIAHPYPASRITVPEKFVKPPKEVQARIDAEAAIKRGVFSSSPENDRRWLGAFTAPVNTRYTSSFGARRVYNGETKSTHQGLDYSALPGTIVRAANSGHVALAREMYFEGGLVVLDHGESIFTLYMHLSEFLVKEGSVVEKGAEIAKSGSTGRVTGPHLHFAVQWKGIYVEPSTLLRLWQ